MKVLKNLSMYEDRRLTSQYAKYKNLSCKVFQTNYYNSNKLIVQTYSIR